MIWLFLLIVLMLMVASRGFRTFVFGLLGLAALVAAVAYFQNQADEKRRTSEITFGDLALEDLRLGPGSFGYRLTGRIRNRSRYHLDRVDMRITLRDCAIADPTSCDTVGESLESIYITVPSGQVRDLDRNVYFGSATKIRGQFVWDYRLVGTHSAE